jgi:hypothetical protein
MHGGRIVHLALFRGEPNVKSRTSVLEPFKTQHVFGVSGGKIKRDLSRFTGRPHNAFSASVASCS